MMSLASVMRNRIQNMKNIIHFIHEMFMLLLLTNLIEEENLQKKHVKMPLHF